MKIGFTCGAFDLLHSGHIVMLKQAKENCDHLIVGLQSDPSICRENKNKPFKDKLKSRRLLLFLIMLILDTSKFNFYLIFHILGKFVPHQIF